MTTGFVRGAEGSATGHRSCECCQLCRSSIRNLTTFRVLSMVSNKLYCCWRTQAPTGVLSAILLKGV